MIAHQRTIRARLLALVVAFLPALAQAHGGVVAEDDLCVINVGYLKAHFKIYVPSVSGQREYCEDIPVRGASVFVMEYLHDGLSDRPIAFRIIRNTTGKGNFARQADVDALPDLDAVTLRYQPPSIVPDVFLLLQEFPEEGEFIGIVTAGTHGGGQQYSAVFPFVVGSTGTGVWPWIVAALVALQLQFWFWRRRTGIAAAALFIMLAALPATALEANAVASEHGTYSLEFAPSITPLVINRLHYWDIEVRDRDGAPVTAAHIEVSGGMPAHDHGLATVPRVSPGPAPGHYRIDGLRFHMPGEWRLDLTIDDGTHRDVVRILLTL